MNNDSAKMHPNAHSRGGRTTEPSRAERCWEEPGSSTDLSTDPQTNHHNIGKEGRMEGKKVTQRKEENKKGVNWMEGKKQNQRKK